MADGCALCQGEPVVEPHVLVRETGSGAGNEVVRTKPYARRWADVRHVTHPVDVVHRCSVGPLEYAGYILADQSDPGLIVTGVDRLARLGPVCKGFSRSIRLYACHTD